MRIGFDKMKKKYNNKIQQFENKINSGLNSNRREKIKLMMLRRRLQVC